MNLFVALLVNAFDTRDTATGPEVADVQPKKWLPGKKAIESLISTRKTRLFVSTYKEPFRLFELRVLESNCKENVRGVVPLQDLTNNPSSVNTGKYLVENTVTPGYSILECNSQFF